MKHRVVVRTPASSANMGPGFDCLAVALDIWNSATIEIGSPRLSTKGHGSELPNNSYAKLVQRCFAIPFYMAGLNVPDVSIDCKNDIPAGKGLGSSAAAILAGIHAGNELSGAELDSDTILRVAAEAEGHPDNVAAAARGGCQIVVPIEGDYITATVPFPQELKAVLYIPDMPKSTDKTRKLLPPTYSRKDVVFNLGRVALLVRALSTGDLKYLNIATQDVVHQPTRVPLYPGMKNVLRAALSAGALGAYLSGSGSSVLALTNGHEMTIGYEMTDAADKSGLTGELKITAPTARGAYVAESG
ncbi:MAG: homoserine kinase [Chloroflexi bacterium]|nr:homoserine kinase [Chloroflexota bacterium]